MHFLYGKRDTLRLVELLHVVACGLWLAALEVEAKAWDLGLHQHPRAMRPVCCLVLRNNGKETSFCKT